MFLYHKWMLLPLATRQKIASAFGIVKRGPTHVDSNIIVSDGYAIKEVEEALNIDALQGYVGTEESDMSVLWDLFVAKIEGRSEPKEIVKTILVEEVVEVPKKKGRPKKNV